MTHTAGKLASWQRDMASLGAIDPSWVAGMLPRYSLLVLGYLWLSGTKREEGRRWEKRKVEKEGNFPRENVSNRQRARGNKFLRQGQGVKNPPSFSCSCTTADVDKNLDKKTN